jgi:hypothetical protein
MTDRPNDLLLLAGKILTVIVQIVLALVAGAVLVALTLVIVFQNDINAEIAAQASGAGAPLPLMAVIGLMALALAAFALIFVFLGRLRAIISSVGEGDPFEPANAIRLNLMAWLLLGVQVLMIPIAGLGLIVTEWAGDVESANIEIEIDASPDLTGILMVVVLFILARVFKHGAAMRDDLEGTV